MDRQILQALKIVLVAHKTGSHPNGGGYNQSGASFLKSPTSPIYINNLLCEGVHIFWPTFHVNQTGAKERKLSAFQLSTFHLPWKIWEGDSWRGGWFFFLLMNVVILCPVKQTVTVTLLHTSSFLMPDANEAVLGACSRQEIIQEIWGIVHF